MPLDELNLDESTSGSAKITNYTKFISAILEKKPKVTLTKAGEAQIVGGVDATIGNLTLAGIGDPHSPKNGLNSRDGYHPTAIIPYSDDTKGTIARELKEWIEFFNKGVPAPLRLKNSESLVPVRPTVVLDGPVLVALTGFVKSVHGSFFGLAETYKRRIKMKSGKVVEVPWHKPRPFDKTIRENFESEEEAVLDDLLTDPFFEEIVL